MNNEQNNNTAIAGEEEPHAVEPEPGRRVPIFYYGSFIIPRVLREHGFEPDRVIKARLPGYDVRIDPLTRLVRSDQHSAFGIIAHTSHAELAALYSSQWMDAYLPEPVTVAVADDLLLAAITYRPDRPISEASRSDSYVSELVQAAADHGFPDWYVERLRQWM